jgi:hypothetical protein
VRHGGCSFSKGHLRNLLINPLYVGEISHYAERYPGRHEAIIDRVTWDAVQGQLAANTVARRHQTNAKEPSLLTGLVFDETGDRLSPDHAVKAGHRHRYYVSRRLLEGAPDDQNAWRLPARELEQTVISTTVQFLRDRTLLIAELSSSGAHPHELSAVLEGARKVAAQLEASLPSEQRRSLLAILDRVELRRGKLHIRLDRRRLTQSLVGDDMRALRLDSTEGQIELVVPISLRRRGVEAKLIVVNSDGDSTTTKRDDKLIGLIAKAHTWLVALGSGSFPTIGAIAEKEGFDAGDVSRLLPLAFLAPDIVEAILEGQQPVELTADRLKRMTPVPLAWSEQRKALGFEGLPAFKFWRRKPATETGGPNRAK